MFPDTENKEENSSYKWYESVGFVIFILLFFGPFGIPLLFKSRRFTRRWKWILSAIVILVAVFATYETIRLVQRVLNYFERPTA